MRRIKASFESAAIGSVRRAVLIEQLTIDWQPNLNFFAITSNSEERDYVDQLKKAGLSNVEWIECADIKPGDVAVGLNNSHEIAVLYRQSDRHHSIQLTNRCNSYCVMCSQPPTKKNDDWMAEEALSIIQHMAPSPSVIGLSGGEPLLLQHRLRGILNGISEYHPSSRVEVLTNGRLLADKSLSQLLLADLSVDTTWLVPLYGHTDFLHDFVVQSPGAYEETLEGLLNLQSYGQPIQLRIVLIKPVLEVLPELCTFIGRNLPFVQEVALMACESIGFALANREMCEVDLLDWHLELQNATRELMRYNVPFLFMNAPLCTLPLNLRSYAHRSISDWKNVYAPECNTCSDRPECAGFFAWHERGWKPSKTIGFIQKEAI